MIYKQLGLDQILEKVIQKLGNVSQVYLTGQLFEGLNQGPFEIILVGNKINLSNLIQLVEKVEKSIGRSITHIIYKPVEMKTEKIKSNEWLLLWDLK